MFQTFNLFKTSLTSAVVVAVCCFTPVLVILLGAVGLSWLVGYLDYVLFPALFIFIALTGYAWWRNNQNEAGKMSLSDSSDG